MIQPNIQKSGNSLQNKNGSLFFRININETKTIIIALKIPAGPKKRGGKDQRTAWSADRSIRVSPARDFLSFFLSFFDRFETRIHAPEMFDRDWVDPTKQGTMKNGKILDQLERVHPRTKQYVDPWPEINIFRGSRFQFSVSPGPNLI